MGAIGKKLRRAVGTGRVMLMHWCPGCEDSHGIIIENSEGRPVWSFDGNYDAPTFGPSVRCYTTHTTDDDDRPLPSPVEETLCHYFIVAGQIQFCSDSPHALAGQTVPLPDWPYGPGSYGGIEE